MSTVLDTIEARRRALGWTMPELSTRSGLSVSQYAAIRRNRAATLHSLTLLCDALGLELVAVPRAGLVDRARVPCGTATAARRHQARGEDVCGPCRVATRAYDRERKRAQRAAVGVREVA